jgi:hypothetical protein
VQLPDPGHIKNVWLRRLALVVWAPILVLTLFAFAVVVIAVFAAMSAISEFVTFAACQWLESWPEMRKLPAAIRELWRADYGKAEA